MRRPTPPHRLVRTLARVFGMLRAAVLVFLLAAGALLPVKAQAGVPVLVELFTSQGCSACPPADRYIAALAKRDDVVPLSLHVDYWDYLGWRDMFAQHRFTKRQKAYARAARLKTIYTPQFIVHGRERIPGFDPDRIEAAINRAKAQPDPVLLKVERKGNLLKIDFTPRDGQAVGPCVIQLIRYLPRLTVEITRGENEGLTLSYANIVEEWSRIGEWEGRRPGSITVPVTGTLPVVIVIQHKGPAEVASVARLQ